MKNFVASLIVATLALPVCAVDYNETVVIAKVLEYHFRRTHPYFRDSSIVSAATRVPSSADGALMVGEVIGDAAVADQTTLALSRRSSRIILPDTTAKNIFDLSKFATNETYDWTRVAEAFPEAVVAFEVSRPTFDSKSERAIVRLDGMKLRGSNVGRPFAMLYSAGRAPGGEWKVTYSVAPCCERPKPGK